jgi:hypothetical protein
LIKLCSTSGGSMNNFDQFPYYPGFPGGRVQFVDEGLAARRRNSPMASARERTVAKVGSRRIGNGLANYQTPETASERIDSAAQHAAGIRLAESSRDLVSPARAGAAAGDFIPVNRISYPSRTRLFSHALGAVFSCLLHGRAGSVHLDSSK